MTTAARWVRVTGFEPFDEWERNPSWDAAQAAAEWLDASCEELQVTYALAERYTSGAVPKQPWLMLHFGLCGGDLVRIERFAHNVRGRDESADAEPSEPTRLLASGPLALESTLPTWRIAREVDELLGAVDVRAVESRDTGDFVCNAIYFHSLLVAERSAGAALFVHLPFVDAEVAGAIGRAVATAVAQVIDDEQSEILG